MPKFIQRLFPERIWAFSPKEKTVYLTFDDGPIPDVTPWVLDELKTHNAKATFFCIGENIEKHPIVYQRIISEGHSVGNHTFNHLNGWKTETSTYVDNVLKAEIGMQVNSQIKNHYAFIIKHHQSLFRPPYGKITSKQAKILHKRGFKIVMWDIISFDYDATISEEKCLQNVLKNIKPGSIVVFHDSLKAKKNLRYVLPRVLDFISEKGWKSSSIQY
jgi:peptidoglycan/xylan/chitin deacetylase (PgdA/CDA1 family)